MSINVEIFELTRNVPEGYFVFAEDIESGESQWNVEAVEYFGFSDCTFGNTREVIRCITHADDWIRLEQELDEVFSKEKEAFYLSVRMKNAKGEYVPCTCKGKLVSDTKGNMSISSGKGERTAVCESKKRKAAAFLFL